MKKAIGLMVMMVMIAGVSAWAADMGYPFTNPPWGAENSTDWMTSYDMVSIDGTFSNNGGGYIGVDFLGDPPTGDAILEKSFTRVSGDPRRFVAKLKWQSELFNVASGGYRTTYIDYSLDGGASWIRGSEVTAVNPTDLYQIQTMQTKVELSPSVSNLLVRYGTVDNGDWRVRGNLILNTQASFGTNLGDNFTKSSWAAGFESDFSQILQESSGVTFDPNINPAYVGVNVLGIPEQVDPTLEKHFYRTAGDDHAYQVSLSQYWELFGLINGQSRTHYVDYSLDEGTTWTRKASDTKVWPEDAYAIVTTGGTITILPNVQSLYVRYAVVDTGDWRANGSLILNVKAEFTQLEKIQGDVNEDGVVDSLDLDIVASDWGKTY
jgi:hypothetical protein